MTNLSNVKKLEDIGIQMKFKATVPTFAKKSDEGISVLASAVGCTEDAINKVVLNLIPKEKITPIKSLVDMTRRHMSEWMLPFGSNTFKMVLTENVGYVRKEYDSFNVIFLDDHVKPLVDIFPQLVADRQKELGSLGDPNMRWSKYDVPITDPLFATLLMDTPLSVSGYEGYRQWTMGNNVYCSNKTALNKAVRYRQENPTLNVNPSDPSPQTQEWIRLVNATKWISEGLFTSRLEERSFGVDNDTHEYQALSSAIGASVEMQDDIFKAVKFIKDSLTRDAHHMIDSLQGDYPYQKHTVMQKKRDAMLKSIAKYKQINDEVFNDVDLNATINEYQTILTDMDLDDLKDDKKLREDTSKQMSESLDPISKPTSLF